MGTVTADAILSSEKSDEMHGVSCLTNTYCELGAVMFLTPLMAVFNLPRSPDLDDPSETRTADYKRMGYQALQLIALEVVLSFVTTFARFRFHDIDLARVFRRAERKHAADAKTRPLARVFTYRFWVYALMSVFFSMCVVGTVLGTLWSTAVCPRVRAMDTSTFPSANRKRGNTSPEARRAKAGVSSPCTSTGPRGNRPIPSTRATREANRENERANATRVPRRDSRISRRRGARWSRRCVLVSIRVASAQDRSALPFVSAHSEATVAFVRLAPFLRRFVFSFPSADLFAALVVVLFSSIHRAMSARSASRATRAPEYHPVSTT